MRLDVWAKRFFPVIVMLLLMIAASLQASGVSHLVGAAIAPRYAMIAPALAMPATRPLPPERRPSAQAILDRNPFDSTWAPNAASTSEPEEAVGEPGADWYKDPACDAGRVVIIASSSDASWSFAALAGADGATVLRRRGDEFAGSKVAFIGDRRDEGEPRAHEGDARSDRVWLTAPNGTRCQLALGAKPKAAAKAPAAPAGPTSDLVSKIHKRGDRLYDVDRTAIESLVANPAELMKVRVVPVKQGDQVTGLGLHGIKPGSVLGAIGLQNDDQLTAINGFEMTDPHKMLEAYTKLMTADHLTASVIRGGKPVNIELDVK